jgi:hypothetical protein
VSVSTPSFCSRLFFVALAMCLTTVSLAIKAQAADPAAPAPAAAETKTPEPAAGAAPETATTTTTANAAIPSNDELLAQQVPADQIWWLTAGEDKFLGLYISEETGRDSYGAALILPDPGRPADWPVLTRTLRELLPKHRWHTLAINPSTDNATLQARIEAAIKQLRSKNINNIALIAEGKTALSALQYSQIHAGQLRAMVLLNPDHQGLVSVAKTTDKAADAGAEKTEPVTTENSAEKTATETPPGQQDLLLESIAMLTIPCLDMATGGSVDDMTHAAQRLAVSRRLKPGQYQQVSLPDNNSPVSDAQENPLSKRVRGWLGKNALPPKAQPSQ